MLCYVCRFKLCQVHTCYLSVFLACEKSRITGNVRHNKRTNVATLILSGVHKDATTNCKLNDGPFVKCKFF